MFPRTAMLAYGVICYAVFFATFIYAIGFIDNLFVPTALDAEGTHGIAGALAIDIGLLALFAIQHSLMARQWFKRAWIKVIPPLVERSTYVLLASVCLDVLFWQWRSIGGTIWSVNSALVREMILSVYAAGWVIILAATFLINHFDLFGRRQAWAAFRGQQYLPVPFQTPSLYKLVRHPLYVGWILVFWSSPKMTIGHLLFAIATTAYILIAIRFEERDLVAIHGKAYDQYRQDVPMLVPRSKPSVKTETSDKGLAAEVIN